VNPRKAYGKMEVQFHEFFGSELDGGKCCVSHSYRFNPGKGPPIPVKRRLGGPRPSLKALEKRKVEKRIVAKPVD
jgi:hypothetical protein